MGLPEELRVNAFVDDQPVAASELADQISSYLYGKIYTPPEDMGVGGIDAPAPSDPKNWQDPNVGWGLILPENPNLGNAAKARAEDAPPPIQELVMKRGSAPVFRYDSKADHIGSLRRYYPDGSQDPQLVGSASGVGKGRLPRYLLIYATPDEIPWSVQFRLNHMAFVGRLDLEGEALENYVTALLDDWGGAPAKLNHAVIWAVDHGGNDITVLMRRAIAEKLHAEMSGPMAGGCEYIDGSQQGGATQAALIAKLVDKKPGLIVTTSHGMTGPLNDAAKMRSQMGLPVDSNYKLLDIDALTANWSPGGAIWYAHACCSAGNSAESRLADLMKPGSEVGKLLRGLANSGSSMAPLPRKLLGEKQPLRAFIGQVEPTFDWTLQHNRTNQILTKSTRDALFSRLYQPYPVGYALDELHRQSTKLKALQVEALLMNNEGIDNDDELLAFQLTAYDRESLVVLGDPVAAFPADE